VRRFFCVCKKGLKKNLFGHRKGGERSSYCRKKGQAGNGQGKMPAENVATGGD